MTDKTRLKDRARDELFSHINRCGVISAAEEDQKSWMDETMEYLGERYPDLADADLKELYTVGIRFCRPAISRVAPTMPQVQPVVVEPELEAVEESTAV